MNVKQRIMTCRLLEKMNEQRTYFDRLGLRNESTFHGIPINDYDKQFVKKG
ncbi:MAG: hypothetical protein PUB13_06460 [Lachnospiraceae bacterium]|nr:hypothetical protein [Lachnospiraceae bacterium]